MNKLLHTLIGSFKNTHTFDFHFKFVKHHLLYSIIIHCQLNRNYFKLEKLPHNEQTKTTNRKE